MPKKQAVLRAADADAHHPLGEYLDASPGSHAPSRPSWKPYSWLTGWLAKGAILAATWSVAKGQNSHSVLDKQAFDESGKYFEVVFGSDAAEAVDTYDPDYWTFQTTCNDYYSNTSLKNLNQIVRDTWEPEEPLSIKYEWSAEKTVGSVFLLFDTSMMSVASDYETIKYNVEITIQASEGASDDGKTWISDSSGGLGSGFYELDTPITASTLEIKITNKSDEPQQLRIAAVHLYGSANLLKSAEVTGDANTTGAQDRLDNLKPSGRSHQQGENRDVQATYLVEDAEAVGIEFSLDYTITDLLIVAESRPNDNMGDTDATDPADMTCETPNNNFLSSIQIGTLTTGSDEGSSLARIAPESSSNSPTQTIYSGMNYRIEDIVSEFQFIRGGSTTQRLFYIGIFGIACDSSISSLCTTCATSASSCSTCIADATLTGGVCSCDDGFTHDSDNNECVATSSQVCDDGFEVDDEGSCQEEVVSIKCETNQFEKYDDEEDNMECIDCDETCATCYSEEHCSTCPESYFLGEHFCVECISEEFILGDECIGYDLEDYDLDFLEDFDYEDFEDFDLEDFDLEDFDLEDFDLEDFDLEDFDLEDFDLEDFDFEDFDLEDFDFENFDLEDLKDLKDFQDSKDLKDFDAQRDDERDFEQLQEKGDLKAVKEEFSRRANEEFKFDPVLFQRMGVPDFEMSFVSQKTTADSKDVAKKKKEIVPKVAEIGQSGTMLIEFDPPIAKVPDSWEQYFNKANRESLSEEEKVQAETYISKFFQVIFVKNSDEKNQANFYPEIADFTPAGLSINLQFSDPLLVSQGDESDFVKVRLLKEFFTQIDDSKETSGQNKGRKLQEIIDPTDLYHEFISEVPKQVKSAQELQQLESAVDSAQNFMLGQFMISFVVNLLLSGTLSQLWNIFNTLQLLTALPLFAINTPGNVIAMNTKFSEIANFKLVEKEQLYDWIVVPIFGTSTSQEKLVEEGVVAEPIEISAETTDLEQLLEPMTAEDAAEETEAVEESYLNTFFQGSNLLMNILLIAIVLIFFTCIITLVVMCRRFIQTRCCNCAKKGLRKIESKLMFNSVLRAVLEAYFTFAIATWYQLKTASFEDSESTTNFFLSLAFLSALILFPILQHCFLVKHQPNLEKEEMVDKYGSLYQNVKTEKTHFLRFTLYFCLRRLAFAFVISFLQESVVLQILVADFSVLGMLAFYIPHQPMQGFANNFVQIFNESVVLLIVISLVLFTDFVPNPVDRYDLGYALLYIIAFNIAVNITVLIFTIVYKIYSACRSFFIKRRKQKLIDELIKKKGETVVEKDGAQEDVKDRVPRRDPIALQKISEVNESESSSSSISESDSGSQEDSDSEESVKNPSLQQMLHGPRALTQTNAPKANFSLVDHAASRPRQSIVLYTDNTEARSSQILLNSTTKKDLSETIVDPRNDVTSRHQGPKEEVKEETKIFNEEFEEIMKQLAEGVQQNVIGNGASAALEANNPDDGLEDAQDDVFEAPPQQQSTWQKELGEYNQRVNRQAAPRRVNFGQLGQN